MKRGMARLIQILLFTCVCAQFLCAQKSPWPELYDWEGSGFGGGSFVWGPHQFPTTVTGSTLESSRTVTFHYAPSYVLALRLKDLLGDFWGADLEYSFANQPFSISNLSPGIPTLPLGQSIHQFTYNVGYMFLTPGDRWRPYFRVGAGTTLFYIHGGSKDQAQMLGVNLRDAWKFAVNWGAGVNYRIEDQVHFTFDAKDQITGIPSYGLPRSTQVVNGVYQPGVAPSGLLHNMQFRVGMSFQWDYW